MENVLNVLSEHFDYIIVDLPPVNIVSDAMAISSYITGMIVVIREGYTSKKDLDRCMRQIKLSEVNVLGCVMNESEEGSASYSKYGRYKKNKHYYSEEYRIQDKEEFNL